MTIKKSQMEFMGMKNTIYENKEIMVSNSMKILREKVARVRTQGALGGNEHALCPDYMVMG